MKERTLLSVKLITSHILLLPVLMFISILLAPDYWLLMAAIQVLLIIILLAGYWEFFGLRFRIFYGLAIEAILLTILICKLSEPLTHSPIFILQFLLACAALFFMFELGKILYIILFHNGNSIGIEFPLQNGLYLITDGGNSKLSRLMNYHYYSPVHKKKGTNNSMKFAADIVKIDSKRKSYLPPANTDYAIFGEKVYCPLSGTVIKVVNDIPDNIPYSGHYPYNTGNTVVIRSNEYFFLIGHLKQESILVKAGDKVVINDLLAEAGNSGLSERPHIHMQLIYSKDENFWSGTGVDISFRKKTLYKNRIIRVT